jgi:plastocyanin
MLTNYYRAITLKRLAALLIINIVLFSSLQAATHVIKFGGGLGLVYSPNQLNVVVGDTIRWEGSFTSHPLSSTSVPHEALTFHSATGSTFSYQVQVAGTYNYQCDFHFASGMTGSFTASVTDVENQDTGQQPQVFRLEQNYPNPFNSSTVIKFTLPASQRVTLKVYSVTGEVLAALLDTNLPAGNYTVPFDAGLLASGIYFYQLVTDRFAQTKRLVLAK